MSRLPRFFKKNGPVILILSLVLLLSGASLSAGIVKWQTNGMTDNTMILILFGAIVATFVVVGLFITIFLEPPVSNLGPHAAYSDPPPKYRETWRIQHLERVSQATDSITGAAASSLDTRRTDTSMNASRTDVRRIWNTLEIPAVHESSGRSASLSYITELPQNRPAELSVVDMLTTRPGRSYTVPQVFRDDEGLPSYEEALGR